MSKMIRKRGLECEAALKCWSDPVAYAGMEEFSDAATSHTNEAHSITRWREYRKRRSTLEETFVRKLQEGELFASGIPRFGKRREQIESSLWDDLEIDYDLGEICGPGQIYSHAEFFEPTDVPTDKTLPEWFEKPQEKYFFPHDPGYRHVTAGGVIFGLGDEQRRVVAFLHRKALENDPWQATASIQDGAQVRGSMRNLFGSKIHWSELLLSDGTRYYRLRDRPGMVMAGKAKPGP
jgi:hypothetical protein